MTEEHCIYCGGYDYSGQGGPDGAMRTENCPVCAPKLINELRVKIKNLQEQLQASLQQKGAAVGFVNEFIESRERFIEEYAAQHRSNSYNGTVTLKECPVCGTLDWLSTSPTGTGVCIESRSAYDDMCDSCHSVRARAPEVYRWVMQVVAFNSK